MRVSGNNYNLPLYRNISDNKAQNIKFKGINWADTATKRELRKLVSKEEAHIRKKFMLVWGSYCVTLAASGVLPNIFLPDLVSSNPLYLLSPLAVFALTICPVYRQTGKYARQMRDLPEHCNGALKGWGSKGQFAETLFAATGKQIKNLRIR